MNGSLLSIMQSIERAPSWTWRLGTPTVDCDLWCDSVCRQEILVTRVSRRQERICGVLMTRTRNSIAVPIGGSPAHLQHTTTTCESPLIAFAEAVPRDAEGAPSAEAVREGRAPLRRRAVVAAGRR